MDDRNTGNSGLSAGKSFVHEKGICESANVGEGTRIWAFAHVLPGARIGMNCNICDHVFIENDVAVGDDVTIKSGVQLWDGVRIGDRVFVGPNTTFTNDRMPRSKVYPERYAKRCSKTIARSAPTRQSSPVSASAATPWWAPVPSSRAMCLPMRRWSAIQPRSQAIRLMPARMASRRGS